MIKRTHNCGILKVEQVGERVGLQGWAQTRRDHGGVIFIDLRDRSGVIQLVFNYEDNREVFNLAERVRSEYVLAVEGDVVSRSPETVNPKIPTGEIEVMVNHLEILNPSKTPPFYIEDGIDVDENLRLRYRYLDLRRPEMQEKLYLRHKIIKTMRDFLEEVGFWEVETPVLTRSTPEGARDYLVPSRIKPGSFFALPQSPQLFKQLLMVSGMEKYFQIARCFRDEDLRADRQPEFTQLDMEMSFVDDEDIMGVIEGLLSHLYKEVTGESIKIPFRRMPYREAVNRYGTDKPDLRFGLELQDISHVVKGSQFKVFNSVLAGGGVVKGINIKGAHFSRKEVDDLTDLSMKLGAKGLAWFMVESQGLKSPINKFFEEEKLVEISQKMDAREGDVLIFVADAKEKTEEVLGEMRLHLAEKMQLIPEGENIFLWVTEFPLLSYNKGEKRYDSNHHPFTSPHKEDEKLLEEEPLQVRAQAYDLVLNGVEIGGGSVRIHRRELQEKILELLGFTPEEAQEKFGFLLNAFEYGTPPHGGIALGLDRLIMLMTESRSIREIIPFPKTASGSCLLTDAPAPVSLSQLEELCLRLELPEDENLEGKKEE